MHEKLKDISPEKKKQMISVIKEFFIEKRDEEIGDLAASIVLDFFMKELAPEFYNKGVYDSYQYMNERVEELFGIQIY